MSGNIQIVNIGEEVSEKKEQSIDSVYFPLPERVDISQSLTFPNIGNQGNYESCIAWSLAYYQLTNNSCVVNKKQARTLSGQNIPKNIMSPQWLYNLTTFGSNTPVTYAESCNILMRFGCPEINLYSKDILSICNEQWRIDTRIWQRSFCNKPKMILYGSFFDDEDDDNYISVSENITLLKRILSNGYVVTFATNIGAYNYTQFTDSGEWACTYVGNGNEQWHAMTLVGYDDNFWIDINGNEVHDIGEEGAFKIANSWGKDSEFSNEGFLWLAYDALEDVSNIENMPEIRDKAIHEFYFIKP